MNFFRCGFDSHSLLFLPLSRPHVIEILLITFLERFRFIYRHICTTITKINYQRVWWDKRDFFSFNRKTKMYLREVGALCPDGAVVADNGGGCKVAAAFDFTHQMFIHVRLPRHFSHTKITQHTQYLYSLCIRRFPISFCIWNGNWRYLFSLKLLFFEREVCGINLDICMIVV